MDYSPKKCKNKEQGKDNNDDENKIRNVELIKEKILLISGDIVIQKYFKGCLLGKGAYSESYEFTFNGKLYVGKIFPKSYLERSRVKQKLIKEIKIHKKLFHPNIMKFEHYFEDEKNVYVLFELCANQTLNELVMRRKNLTELEVQYYIIQLIQALRYLQSKRIIHRNLNLRSLYLTEKMELKLGNFNRAVKLDFEGQKRRTLCGDIFFAAPEILNEKPYSYEVDIWALGVIIYILIIGILPFDSSDSKKIKTKIKYIEYSFPKDAHISEAAKDLITQILVLDPQKRPNLEQILMHDFFKLGNSIPKSLPSSTLSCKPHINYIRKFMPEADEFGIVNKKVNTINLLEQKINLEELKNDNPEEEDLTVSKPNIWVIKYVDYSSKYGLGYVLNNGNFGVFFNDRTKIILNPKTKKFFYIGNKEVGKPEEFNKYDLEDYPKEINNKVILLIHFKKYFEGEMKEDKTKIKFDDEKRHEDTDRDESEDKNEIINGEEDIDKTFIYVKSWTRTSNALLFRFSNSLIQFVFQDHTEIILSGECMLVTYVNKKRERLTYPLGSISKYYNFKLIKRLKYAKEILMDMLNSKKNNQENSDNLDEKSKNKEHDKQDKEMDKLKNNEKDKGKEKKEEK